MVDYMMAVAMVLYSGSGKCGARRRSWSLRVGDKGQRFAQRSRWRVFLPERIR
ncbi:MAG: hypothetical protein JJ913_09390 [Rhizobiaceae bacterium]|nr:hypothetical protein [Rhizobiaceae bacterium]